jgi:hypothetical protein
LAATLACFAPNPCPIFDKNRALFEFFRTDFAPPSAGFRAVSLAQVCSFISHTPLETSLQL